MAEYSSFVRISFYVTSRKFKPSLHRFEGWESKVVFAKIDERWCWPFFKPAIFKIWELQLWYETYLAKALNKATISLLSNWKPFLFNDMSEESNLSTLSENRIFKAVPRPWIWNVKIDAEVTFKFLYNYWGRKKNTFILTTWSFPQSLHLSQPTQSMMEEILRKCWRNSSFNDFPSNVVSWNMTLSLKWNWNSLKTSIIFLRIRFQNEYHQIWIIFWEKL